MMDLIIIIDKFEINVVEFEVALLSYNWRLSIY